LVVVGSDSDAFPQMASSRILVTGATGFTGGHLARRLATQGHAVRALVRGKGQSVDLTQHGIEPVVGDLCDPASLDAATRGIDTVYHIAAAFRQEGMARELFWQINAQGTKLLIEAAIRNGVSRFVHCSTVGVHGDIEHPPANEDATMAPGDHYQESKLEGENIAAQYMRDGRIALTIFRPAGIFGPGDMRFLKLFRSIKRRRFIMIGDGSTLYHLTYIDDLVDGIILCGTVDAAIGQAYILAGDQYGTLKDLVGLIAEELAVPPPRLHIPMWPVYCAAFMTEVLCKPLGIEPPLYRRRVDFFRKSRAFDISKAKADLGYRPKTGLREGIRRTARWYADQGYL
jgi:nucleoside-diphosphate-sugar epimerase